VGVAGVLGSPGLLVGQLREEGSNYPRSQGSAAASAVGHLGVLPDPNTELKKREKKAGRKSNDPWIVSVWLQHQ